LQLDAALFDVGGQRLPPRPVTWTTSDSALVTVSSTGLLSARAAGTAVVTATSEGKHGTASVQVRDPATAVATVTIESLRTRLTTGDTVPLRATVRDAAGQVLTGRHVSWQLTVTAGAPVASLGPDGLLVALTQGRSIVEAVCEGRKATLPIEVNDALDTGIVVTFAEPIHMDSIGDTLHIKADVRHRFPLQRVVASIGPLATTLVLTPVGRGALVWAGTIVLSDLRVGPYTVRVDAVDARGALGRATRDFIHVVQPREGGTPPGPRSK
jgi:Bacterial Ig-like domain (group 2)